MAFITFQNSMASAFFLVKPDNSTICKIWRTFSAKTSIYDYESVFEHDDASFGMMN